MVLYSYFLAALSDLLPGAFAPVVDKRLLIEAEPRYG
jgi:hypothetical protein